MASAGDLSETPLAHVIFILGVAVFATSLPEQAYAIIDSRTGLVIGVIGVWRYGWGVLHFLRSVVYRARVYPRLKRKVMAEWSKESRQQPHAYFLVTSFRIPTATTIEVYRAAFAAAKAAPGSATVVASIVEMADQRLIKALFQTMVGTEDAVRLVFVRIAGTGKRDALAYGFRAVSRLMPDPDSMVAVIDGDSIVPEDLVRQCAPFFADPKVGALTTDEIARVNGRWIFRRWYNLRFAQRQILMSSMGLSRRVLTLTGRMSMFRASIICNRSFVSQVETDYVDHPRFGRFQFLTGDDKSSWFWLLRNDYDMLYLPDITVATIEDPPDDRFMTSATVLMIRWFGNMLRTNSRALALGPRRTGAFVWLAILDQRLSMWTCLVGLMTALLATLFYSPFTILVYVVWILVTRYLLTLLLLSARSRVSVFYPFLLYFNQIYGSLVKTYVFFRLNRQRWTRQNTSLKDLRSRSALRVQNAESILFQATSLLALVAACSWAIGLVSLRGI